jgi:hypothetical protein
MSLRGSLVHFPSPRAVPSPVSPPRATAFSSQPGSAGGLGLDEGSLLDEIVKKITTRSIALSIVRSGQCELFDIVRSGQPDVNYSITLSARLSKAAGTVSPSALAAFILMVRSILVDCCTGKVPGLSPLRIRPV